MSSKPFTYPPLGTKKIKKIKNKSDMKIKLFLGIFVVKDRMYFLPTNPLVEYMGTQLMTSWCTERKWKSF